MNLLIFFFFLLFSSFLFSFVLQNTVCPEGWPLSIHGAVVLHLGTLDECLVNASDLYLCIRPWISGDATSNTVNLSVVWRKFESKEIAYHIFDPDKDPLTSISLEMLTEELPQLLQTLLVSVEQTINRIPFDELSFPSSNGHDDDDETIGGNGMRKSGMQQKPVTASPNGSPKCGLKRREIITKNNKTLHGRYALRRMSVNKSENDSSAISATKEAGAMPLFCLGGSFPHIDSDEDSGADDASKSLNERKYERLVTACLWRCELFA